MNVFEKTINEFDFGEKGQRKAIITRSHLKRSNDTGPTGSMDEDAPVSIAITYFRENSHNSRQGVITLNVNQFRATEKGVQLTGKKEAFDLRDCFTKPQESAWIRLFFPSKFF